MLVSHSSLNPLALNIACSQIVCPDVRTRCVLLWAPCDLMPWCMIFSEVMRAGGTFVPGRPWTPPPEVTFSRLMCSGVGEPCTAQRAGLGVIFSCSPSGPGIPWVSYVWLHPLVHLMSRLSEREVMQKDRSVSGSPSLSLKMIGIWGVGRVAPIRDTWEEWARWCHWVSVRAP